MTLFIVYDILNFKVILKTKFSMKKNNVLLLLLFLSVLVLVLMLAFKNPNKEKSDIQDTSIPLGTPINVVFPTEEPIITDQEKSEIEKEEKIKQEAEVKQKEIDIISLNSAGETGKKELCDEVVDHELKIQCIDNSYAARASIDNNPDLCGKITDIVWKNKCLDNYYYENALKIQDYNLCKKIIDTNLRENCTSSIIFAKIEDPSFKWTIGICDELNWDNKTYCQNKFTIQDSKAILTKAMSTMDVNLCKTITDTNIKNKCSDVINFKLALSTKDKSKCSLIIDPSMQKQCVDKLNIINQ